ncbi:hypothetical protein [[Limnothrix rosea] IAM M-220]|uniref:hypothetical protein n=1 Tax=[Limnothrix rosea] IAM M-220 TaxID=454133 RepID=UPI00096882A3|nr:hypothetical protein [[Limnothrix rosea] IAM M-220]OKH19517.1 hypothetical protein NIES208_01540 [[Limnothrix rosea] IAM M-220]
MVVTDDSPLIEMSLVGGGIAPGQIRGKELGILFSSTEDMIASYTHDKYSVSISEIIIGPKRFGDDGYTIEYQPSIPELTIPAFEELSNRIQTGDIDGLPHRTVENIIHIRDLSKKRKFDARFFTLNGTRKYQTSINEDFKIPEPFMLEGETTLYGKILRVGGDERNPKIRVRLISGDFINCTCSGLSIIRQAGRRLYDVVGLKGIANWDVESMTVKHFHVQDFTDYEDHPIDEAFEQLRGSIGKAFSHIENPIEYFAELRHGTD